MKTTEIVNIVHTDGEIRRLFNRSRLALDIIRELIDGEKYLSELARSCHSDPSNIRLRIHGNKGRYTESMIELGLVFYYRDRHGRIYYGATDLGVKWFNSTLRGSE